MSDNDNKDSTVEDNIENSSVNDNTTNNNNSNSDNNSDGKRNVATLVGKTVLLIALAAGSYYITKTGIGSYRSHQNRVELAKVFERFGDMQVPSYKLENFCVTTDGEKECGDRVVYDDEKAKGLSFVNNSSKTPKHEIDVYIDFSNQRAKDFMLNQQEILENLVVSGTARLNIIPIISEHPYSVGAPLTLQNYVEYNRENNVDDLYKTSDSSVGALKSKTWGLMLALLKDSQASIYKYKLDDKGEKVPDLNVSKEELKEYVVTRLGSTVNKFQSVAGGKEFESMKELNKHNFIPSFYQTLLDYPLPSKIFVPTIIVDGRVVDLDALGFPVNDSEKFEKYLQGRFYGEIKEKD